MLPPTPTLEFVCQFNVQLGDILVVGETPHGLRRVVPIVGGTFESERLRGKIMSGGADWQVVRPDGAIELEAHYQLKTDDDVLIYIKNTGLRVILQDADNQSENTTTYFRTVMTLEAPTGKYDWLNYGVFVCSAIRNPTDVVIHVWKVG